MAEKSKGAYKGLAITEVVFEVLGKRRWISQRDSKPRFSRMLLEVVLPSFLRKNFSGSGKIWVRI